MKPYFTSADLAFFGKMKREEVQEYKYVSLPNVGILQERRWRLKFILLVRAPRRPL